MHVCHGPLARYIKLWVAHAPGMPGTFSSSFSKKMRAACHWLSASTVVPTSASVWGSTSQMCAWGSTSHKCTRFEMQTQRALCTGPVGTGLRRGCQCRPIVILGTFSRVKAFYVMIIFCKLILVQFLVYRQVNVGVPQRNATTFQDLRNTELGVNKY